MQKYKIHLIYLIQENLLNAKLSHFETENVSFYNTSIYLVTVTIRNFTNYFQDCYE